MSVKKINDAIVRLYDEHVAKHGVDLNVFFVATKSQLARHLNVSAHVIDQAIGHLASHGYADYKAELLVRKGRGRFIYYGQHEYERFYSPNREVSR